MQTIRMEVVLAHEHLTSSWKSVQERDPYNLANVCIVSFFFSCGIKKKPTTTTENVNCTLQMMEQRNQQLSDTLNFDFDHTRRKWTAIHVPLKQFSSDEKKWFLSIFLCTDIFLSRFNNWKWKRIFGGLKSQAEKKVKSCKQQRLSYLTIKKLQSMLSDANTIT